MQAYNPPAASEWRGRSAVVKCNGSGEGAFESDILIGSYTGAADGRRAETAGRREFGLIFVYQYHFICVLSVGHQFAQTVAPVPLISEIHRPIDRSEVTLESLACNRNDELDPGRGFDARLTDIVHQPDRGHRCDFVRIVLKGDGSRVVQNSVARQEMIYREVPVGNSDQRAATDTATGLIIAIGVGTVTYIVGIARIVAVGWRTSTEVAVA